MLNLKILIRTVRMAFFLTLVVWAFTAGVMAYIDPVAAERPAAFPLAPINE